MARVLNLSDLVAGPRARLFEGLHHGDGVDLSFFVTETPAGRGPPLHVHPHPEIFLVEEGEASFTIGEDRVAARPGTILVVPAETPHRFENTGLGPLRIVSMHASSEVHQANVEPGAPTRAEPRTDL